MLRAFDIYKNWIYPGESIGYCPACGDVLITKMGLINAHHFAHEVNTSCVISTGEMSDWHIDWQAEYDVKEVLSADKKSRADVVLPNGLVIEFQHSDITIERIKQREQSFKKLFWVFDLTEKESFFIKGEIFTWKQPKRTWLYYLKPAFFDIGDEVIYLKNIDFDYDKSKAGYNFSTLKAEFIPFPRIDFIDFTRWIDNYYKASNQHFHIQSHRYDSLKNTFIA